MRKGSGGRLVTVEREAGFARRRTRDFFGFKAHLAVDEGSGPVRLEVLTPANVNESIVADAVAEGPKNVWHHGAATIEAACQSTACHLPEHVRRFTGREPRLPAPLIDSRRITERVLHEANL